jgi:hypothetical protein
MVLYLFSFQSAGCQHNAHRSSLPNSRFKTAVIILSCSPIDRKANK